MRRRVLWVGLVALMLLWPAAIVHADEPVMGSDSGRIFVGEDVSLEPDEVFQGDLGIFDGGLHMPEGSSVRGDVFLVNGDAHIGGVVDGDLAVLGGDLELTETGQVRGTLFGMGSEQSLAGLVGDDVSVLFGQVVLHSTAVIEGDLFAAPGVVERHAGSQVRGDVVNDVTLPSLPFFAEEPSLPTVPTGPLVQPSPSRSGFGAGVGRAVGRILTAGLLGILVMAIGLVVVFIWPRHTVTVAECISRAPVRSFALGLLTYLIAGGLEVVAVILMILIILVASLMIGTVILIPVGILLILVSALVLLPVPLALAGASVLGWVGLAQRIGERVLRLFRIRDVTPLAAVFAGLLITVPIAALLWIVKPICCAWPYLILLISVGLGAVFHTRFGTQECTAATSMPVIAPAVDEASSDGDLLPLDAMDDEAGQPDQAAP